MLPIYTKNRVIGLLGGSFNPAHEGHLHISLHALGKLGIDQVWWLVSPHNPLKDKNTLADYKKRLQSAHRLAQHPRIWVSDLEARHGLQYTYKTIAFLRHRYPGTRFVWLMGADNLAGFHRWQRWRDIMAMVPIIVFDRVPFSHTALRGKAYRCGYKLFKENSQIKSAPRMPAITFVHLKRNDTSATDLRKTLGKNAFLRHN